MEDNHPGHSPNEARRRVLQSGGILVTALLIGVLPAAVSRAHEGHDHAPRTILDLKGKLVRILGPNEDAGDEFIQDRVTIHVTAEGRIVDLVYG